MREKIESFTHLDNRITCGCQVDGVLIRVLLRLSANATLRNQDDVKKAHIHWMAIRRFIESLRCCNSGFFVILQLEEVA